MSLSRNYSSGGLNYNSSGYDWYQCKCCPYGYHIDLDFVRYCDSVGQTVERTASMKRRKDRRRQRQSMDVLLGLIPPLLDSIDHSHGAIKEYDGTIKEYDGTIKKYDTGKAPSRTADFNKCVLIEDTTLSDAVDDFERTLQRSKKNLSNNLPDVTAVFDNVHRSESVSPTSLASGSSVTVLHPGGGDDNVARDFDIVSIESNGMSSATLQAIREQMALSLERMRKLEDQVKVIPLLQNQVTTLKEEKHHLEQQLEKEENARLNSINANYITASNSFLKSRSHSFTHIDSLSRKERREIMPTRKDSGIMCSVLTRNVGVGHQYPHNRTVSTMTPTAHANQAHYLNGYSEKPKKVISVDKGTQIFSARDKRDVSLQTVDKPTKQKVCYDSSTQTFELRKQTYSIGTSAKPLTSNIHVQAANQVKTVGVSQDTIDKVLCLRCLVFKIDVGTNTTAISGDLLPPVMTSLAKTADPKLSTIKTKTVACQYDPLGVHKSVQCEPKLETRGSQHDTKLVDKSIQALQALSASKNTDTSGLAPLMINVGCSSNVVPNTAEVGCNTTEIVSCAKCLTKDKEKIKSEEVATPSRIPRLQAPTTPVETRKFMRQDTYTKVPTTVEKTPPLINLLGPPFKASELKSTCDIEVTAYTVKTNLHEQLSENTFGNEEEREKAVPTKEMQAAMKVLNDSLQKRHKKNIESQVKNAINIIQQEWFKISSTKTAKPLDVEDYLDCFEEVSSALLEYIVNIEDASGNTAMHYAVSHGNFDVVSILLDSKVCDISKQNKAGYTCVMLVCLADVCSQTHSSVVRRLFSLADVNIKAKEHDQTALMLAVSHGRLDMVKMLLEAGADINIQDEDGSTALMCAAEHGHVDIVKHFLCQPDCDSSICDVDGSTALKIAMEAGHRHIGVLLYAHERNLHGPVKYKRSKSASASPKAPSSPLPIRSIPRPSPSNK